MAEMHFNGSSALTGVVYNGTDLDYVYYNNTLVFEKVKSASDTISFKYYGSGSQTGVSFYFDKNSSYSLSHTPKKITSISGGLGYTSWSITDNLSGTCKMPNNDKTASGSASNFIDFTWYVSGSTITFVTTTSGGGTSMYTDINITYDY